MRFPRIGALLVFLALFLLPPASQAQEQSKSAEVDAAAIKRVFTDFYENFTRHDAHAVALDFAADADFTNMRGTHRHGRKEIEEWMASLFAGILKDSHRTDIVRSIRFLTPDVATVDADTLITGTKASDGSEAPPRNGLMIVTMTKQNGRWMISVFHEAEFPAARAASASAPVNGPSK